MIRICLIFIFCSSLIKANGQIGEQAFYGGVMYKNTGLGISYQSKLDIKEKVGKQFDVELSTFHHAREVKTFNSELSNPTAFVFGKLNKAALLKIQYFRSYKISQFSDAQRVGVDINLGGGFIAGFLKPIYVNIIYPDALGYETIVSEKYNPLKHTTKSRIAGYADGRLGWSEISTKLGINLSMSVGFTWGYFTNYPKRLETGLYLECFNNGLPIMAFTRNKPLQSGLFVKLFLGKRNSKN
jgi:hypothetical protein